VPFAERQFIKMRNLYKIFMVLFCMILFVPTMPSFGLAEIKESTVYSNEYTVNINDAVYRISVEDDIYGIRTVTVSNENETAVSRRYIETDTIIDILVKKDGKTYYYQFLNNSLLDESSLMRKQYGVKYISQVSESWFGFTSYYNTDSAYGSLYWRNWDPQRNPSSVYYFAYDNTSLMSYSTTFFVCVNNMSNYENQVALYVGSTTISSLASAFFNCLNMGITDDITIYSIIAQYIDSSISGYTNAVSYAINTYHEAVSANLYYDLILGCLGY
jgi:hypothetical protein